MPASTSPSPASSPQPAPGLGTSRWVLVGLAVVGLLTAFAGMLVARAIWVIGETTLPWGLVFTVVTTFAVARAAGRLSGFWGAVVFAVGWFVTVSTFVLVSPGGDQLIGSDWTGIAFMGLGVVAVGAVVIREMARPLKR